MMSEICINILRKEIRKGERGGEGGRRKGKEG